MIKGMLLIHDEPKQEWYEKVCKTTLLDCRFKVTNIHNDNDGLWFTYENAEGNYDGYCIENDTQITVRNGRLHWQVDLGDKIQLFALAIDN